MQARRLRSDTAGEALRTDKQPAEKDGGLLCLFAETIAFLIVKSAQKSRKYCPKVP